APGAGDFGLRAVSAARPGLRRSNDQVDRSGGGPMKGPHINWEALSPAISLTAAICVVLLVGLARSSFIRRVIVPALTIIGLGVTAGLAIWQWDVNEAIVARALVIDNLSMALLLVFCAGGIAAVLLSARSVAAVEAGEGEYYALLLTSILGMLVL